MHCGQPVDVLELEEVLLDELETPLLPMPPAPPLPELDELVTMSPPAPDDEAEDEAIPVEEAEPPVTLVVPFSSRPHAAKNDEVMARRA